MYKKACKGLSNNEIAEKMGCSPSLASSLYNKAFTHFVDKLYKKHKHEKVSYFDILRFLIMEGYITESEIPKNIKQKALEEIKNKSYKSINDL